MGKYNKESAEKYTLFKKEGVLMSIYCGSRGILQKRFSPDFQSLSTTECASFYLSLRTRARRRRWAPPPASKKDPRSRYVSGSGIADDAAAAADVASINRLVDI